MASAIDTPVKPAAGGLGFFERFLSLWVALCMGAGIALGKLLPGFTSWQRRRVRQGQPNVVPGSCDR
jgi:ACR3 family arsenite efflux pump ArsB